MKETKRMILYWILHGVGFVNTFRTRGGFNAMSLFLSHILVWIYNLTRNVQEHKQPGSVSFMKYAVFVETFRKRSAVRSKRSGNVQQYA
jgi:hypothetical protein